MRKFGEIYKEKMNEAEIRLENKVLDDFKAVYNAMLEHYGLNSVHQLNEESQLSFLTELNNYWAEETGLNEKGQLFLDKRDMTINENSTAVQKKNFLRIKSYAVINETLRQSNIKFKLYDILDEMYKSLNASDIGEVLSPDMITTIVNESFAKSLNEFISSISKELKNSAKPKRKYFVRTVINENKK